MKQYLILGLLLLMVFPMVSADNIGTFQQNQEMQITNYCQAGDCTYINLTSITSPSPESILVNYNDAMTNNAQTFNYTYTPTKLGTYSFTSCGNPGGTVVCDSDTFEVTPSGLTGNLGFYVLFLVLSLGLIVLGYYVEDAWIIILGSFALVLFGLYVLFYGLAGMKDTAYTWGIGIITLMLGAYFGIRGAIEKIDN